MKRLAALMLGCIVVVSTIMGAGAQGTPGQTECTDFQVYWETLVATTPNDPEGLDAFLAIVDAGPRTVLTEDDQRLAVAFLETWSSNVAGVDASLIPDSARIFHQELIDEFDMTSGIVEYTDLVDLSNTFSFWSVGIYILLIEEAETPTQCI